MAKSSYIIELFRWNPSLLVYEKKDDSTLILDSNTGIMEIVSSEDNSTVYLRVNIKDERITVLSRNETNLASMCGADFTIDYEMFYSGKKFGVRFDARSTSSEDNFFKLFNGIRAKVQFTENYPSGNKRIEGSKTDDGYNGFCVEYYDHKLSPIKYIGEFEDGMYDGEGEFISQDGTIRLVCRNICSNKPNGKGKLIIGKNRNQYMVNMKDCVYDASSESYTHYVFAHVEPDYKDMIQILKFESLSLEERTIYLFKEIMKLKENGNEKSKGSIFNIF